MLTQIKTTFGTSTEVPGYALTRIATPDLKWEKTKQFDLGFDFGFLNNRLELSIDSFIFYHIHLLFFLFVYCLL